MILGGFVDEIALSVTAALAQVATSLDNLVVLLLLILSLGRYHAILGYVLSQAVVLGLAFGVALGAQQVLPGWTGLLGLVPLSLGLRGVFRQWGGETGTNAPAHSHRSGVLGALVVFAGLSFDSFAVLGPLFADSAPGYRIWALVGAGGAVLCITLTALALSHAAKGAPTWSEKLQKLAPLVMITVGVYVLLNTWTDMV